MKLLDNAQLRHGPTLSDLFFNYPHPVFDSLFDGPSVPTYEEQRDAIHTDAVDFAESYGGNADWYADDFMKRL